MKRLRSGVIRTEERVKVLSARVKKRHTAVERKEAILSEAQVDPRTFHHWPDLLPELQNVVVEFLDRITTHCLSMTCREYKTQYYGLGIYIGPHTLAEFACPSTPTRYLRLLIDWLPATSSYISDLVHELMVHGRYSWVSWIIHDLVGEKERLLCINRAHDGAIWYPGVDAHIWVTKQSWYLPDFMSDRTELTTCVIAGNAALADYLLATRHQYNSGKLRETLLMHAWNEKVRKFFNKGILFQNVEWDNAWKGLQEAWTKSPDFLDATIQEDSRYATYSRDALWFYIEIYPHLLPEIRNAYFFASLDWQTKMFDAALSHRDLDALKALEAHNFPLEALIKCSHEDILVANLLVSQAGRDVYVWLWEHAFFGKYYDKYSTQVYCFYKEIKDIIWHAHYDPRQPPIFEKYLTTYPFNGSSLLLDALKIGVRIKDFITD